MKKYSFLKPAPDFEEFIKVCDGLKSPKKVHQVEVIFDEEIKKEIMKNYLDLEYYPPAGTGTLISQGSNSSISTDLDEYEQAKKRYYKSNTDFHHHMGYSIVTDHDFLMGLESLNNVAQTGRDVAPLSRGKRVWAQEGTGMIKDWRDYESFPWKDIEDLLDGYSGHLDDVSKDLPDGMKIAVVGAVNAQILGWVFGFEGLFYLIRDDFELVKAVFDRMGDIIFRMYEIACSKKDVAILWHGDDLGFKTSTLYSPEILRDLLFGWMKRYSSLAHRNNKRFWVHCCGHKDTIMDDFLDYIKIDALHSFEEACCPVIEYKEKYGDRIAILGGVDVDRLARSGEDELRSYIRTILDKCLESGRFVLGSGNSITNYVPVKNFLIMLEEGYNYLG